MPYFIFFIFVQAYNIKINYFNFMFLIQLYIFKIISMSLNLCLVVQKNHFNKKKLEQIVYLQLFCHYVNVLWSFHTR